MVLRQFLHVTDGTPPRARGPPSSSVSGVPGAWHAPRLASPPVWVYEHGCTSLNLRRLLGTIVRPYSKISEKICPTPDRRVCPMLFIFFKIGFSLGLGPS